MKTKYLIALLLAFGLVAGSASAAIVNETPSEVLIIGDGLDPTGTPGVEIDEYATGGQVGTPQLIPVDDWVGLNVLNNGMFSLVSSGGAAGSNATTPLSIEIWNATDGSPGAWSYDNALPMYAGALSTSLVTTLLSGDYLVRIFGNIDATNLSGQQLFNYTLEITSAIPVPAAVWLFGTAMLGLFGFKRKKSMTAA